MTYFKDQSSVEIVKPFRELVEDVVVAVQPVEGVLLRLEEDQPELLVARRLHSTRSCLRGMRQTWFDLFVKLPFFAFKLI